MASQSATTHRMIRSSVRAIPDDERPEILTERIDWQPDPAEAALVIDLVAYFRDVWGEEGS